MVQIGHAVSQRHLKFFRMMTVDNAGRKKLPTLIICPRAFSSSEGYPIKRYLPGDGGTHFQIPSTLFRRVIIYLPPSLGHMILVCTVCLSIMEQKNLLVINEIRHEIKGTYSMQVLNRNFFRHFRHHTHWLHYISSPQ